MPAITLGPARALSCADLTGLLNRAFADDSAPVHLSCADLEATITQDDILIDASHVAYVDGEPAGVALAAVRARREGTRTRLATMGVVPEHRRLGSCRVGVWWASRWPVRRCDPVRWVASTCNPLVPTRRWPTLRPAPRRRWPRPRRRGSSTPRRSSVWGRRPECTPSCPLAPRAQPATWSWGRATRWPGWCIWES